MKKTIFLLFLSLLLVPIVLASQQMAIICTFIMPGDYCGNGECRLPETCSSCVLDCGVCPGGSGFLSVIPAERLPYDLSLVLDKTSYYFSEPVTGVVVFDTTVEGFSARYVTVELYLVSPEGEMFGPVVEHFREVDKVIPFSIRPPDSMSTGHWNVRVVSQLDGAVPVEQYAGFDINTYRLSIFFLILIVLLIVGLLVYTRHQRKKAREKLEKLKKEEQDIVLQS